MNLDRKRVTLAVSGASGVAYTFKLIEELVKADLEISIVISSAGYLVISDESDLTLPGNPERCEAFLTQHFKASPGQIRVYGKDQWSSPLASGSNAPQTMIVCPCSVGCLSAIAVGASNNLLERAADVVIKEQGKLILVVREMPFSPIHLEHMLSLSKIGVVIMPASPGFYFKPKTLDDIVDFVVARILDQIGVSHTLTKRWGM